MSELQNASIYFTDPTWCSSLFNTILIIVCDFGCRLHSVGVMGLMILPRHQIHEKLEGTPRAQTSVKAGHQSPHIFVTPESFGL